MFKKFKKLKNYVSILTNRYIYYSGMFGDYSSYSEEYDEISENESEEEE